MRGPRGPGARDEVHGVATEALRHAAFVMELTRDLAGGGIENWFAYVLALLFLLVKPEGLFGERHINRV